MNNFLLFLFVIFTSFFLTELIRRYSLKKNLLDIPNLRSSHSVATPYGGGLSIVVIFLVTIGFSDLVSKELAYAFLGSGMLVAAVGFWDDQRHIAIKWRLLSHFAVVIWVLYSLGEIETQGFQLAITILILVWLINLFNFMDGIDGIAASEAIFVLCSGAYFLWLDGQEDLGFISLILAASTLGFLFLNWSPAKIFMGNVSSGFLGLMLGIIAYIHFISGGSLWVWMILYAIFLVDTGVTLLRRTINGEKWYQAHCSHAYQHAAKKFGHKKVTVSVIIINLLWLLPLAFMAHLKRDFSIWITLLAFTPLVIIAIKFKSGISVTQNIEFADSTSVEHSDKK